jgi:5-methylcytosine-specific restriction endonuclease McrA
MPTGVYPRTLEMYSTRRGKCVNGLKGTHIQTNTGRTHFKKGNTLDKCVNWKGGRTELSQKIRTSLEYRMWRSDVYTRDNFICQECGYDGGLDLHAHHIVAFSLLVQKYEITTQEQARACDEMWNINNGITLCRNCHNKEHPDLKLILRGGS